MHYESYKCNVFYYNMQHYNMHLISFIFCDNGTRNRYDSLVRTGLIVTSLLVRKADRRGKPHDRVNRDLVTSLQNIQKR